MKRLIFITYITLTALGNSAQAKELFPELPSLDSLLNIQKILNTKQDSIQRALNDSRSLFTGASIAERDSLSEVIISLEGSVFDIRAELAEIGNQIAVNQEYTAQENLDNSAQQTASAINSDKLYEAPLFVESLSANDLELLKIKPQQQENTRLVVEEIIALYTQLKEIKLHYDNASSQQVIDSLRNEAFNLSNEIEQINSTSGSEWQKYFNEVMAVYLVMLDISPNSDRTTLENIDRKNRETLREKSLLQQNSLAPNLTAFNLECQLLLDYQMAIANAADINKAYNALEKVTLEPLECDFPEIEFGQRILTIYSPVVEDYDYGYTKVSEIPEIIIPYKGVYYTVRVALFSSKPTNLSTFRSAGPLQLYKTSEGKYSYQVGGFKTLSEAEEGLAKAKKIGFKSPAIIAYIDGELSTVAKATELQENLGTNIEGEFKVVLKTKNSKDGDILRTLMNEQTQGKQILRINEGDMFVFSVITFANNVEAEEFLLSLRNSLPEGDIAVEQI